MRSASARRSTTSSTTRSNTHLPAVTSRSPSAPRQTRSSSQLLIMAQVFRLANARRFSVAYIAAMPVAHGADSGWV